MESVAFAQNIPQHNRGQMGIFDKAINQVNKWLGKPSGAAAPETDDNYDQIFSESMQRARSTLDAIRQGNLVAASSTIIDEEATAAMRYEFARTSQTSVGAVGIASSQHADKLAASRKSRSDSTGIA